MGLRDRSRARSDPRSIWLIRCRPARPAVCWAGPIARVPAAVKFNHGGTAGSPITLTSYPGQTATLTGGIVYVPQGSDYVTLTGLHIDGAAATTQNTIQIDAAHISVTDSDITNENLARSCFILGSDTGYGAATVPLVQGNVIHECGHVAPNEDHGVYIDNVTGATITDNIFWGIRNGYALHFYPRVQRHDGHPQRHRR